MGRQFGKLGVLAHGMTAHPETLGNLEVRNAIRDERPHSVVPEPPLITGGAPDLVFLCRNWA
jgi:hypothetical protein